MLSRCERKELPLFGGSSCLSCRRRPVIRISVQLDGTEMFWALAC